jgi:hypothetical protein
MLQPIQNSQPIQIIYQSARKCSPEVFKERRLVTFAPLRVKRAVLLNFFIWVTNYLRKKSGKFLEQFGSKIT